MPDSNAFRDYIRSLRDNLARGDATEHTHRPALKILLEAVQPGIIATNEPARIECGAPDFAISTTRLTIGYIEAKRCDISLDAIERGSNRKNPNSDNGKQLKRYRDALPNLILTNYTEFRWYVDGERRLTATLASDDGSGELTTHHDGITDTAELLSAFFAQSPEPVSSPKELSRRMARLTHLIRDVVREAFVKEQESQDVNSLYEATKRMLVADLSLDDFADMFAQTLAYGLFAARVNHKSGDFQRRTAVYDIPAANPFLKEIFALIAGYRAESEPFIGFVDDLAQLLANSDMKAILSDFGKRGVREDPIMHFYEDFLKDYDPALREKRGVYYTPEPVISYIVRSVDHLLRERFDCPEGLADYQTADYEVLEDIDGEQKPVTRQAHRVLVLDPACGTGSFLYAVIDHIREYYRSNDNMGVWEDYVREHLLKRIFGFELMMAPYAMSHLKLGMQLAAQDMPEEQQTDWAYKFIGDERLGVYLTNTLEQAERQTPMLFSLERVIAEEANAASAIKRDLPIMVVLGNPPYSGHSSNASRINGKLTWIGELIEDYKTIDGKPLGERNSKWVDDDYVKFIRFGQQRIQQSGAGILAFITNHSYLDNPTFRGMRQQLMDTFTDIYLLDLHGNSLRKEHAPGGGVDRNVFDIQQGVAIAVLVKEPRKEGQAQIHHADLYGERELKYECLAASDITTTDWEQLQPTSSNNYLFKPWNNELAAEYEQWQKITDIMPVNSVGIITGRDRVAIRWSHDEMISEANDFAFPDGEVMDETLVSQVLYRPFDTRYTYYSKSFITRRRENVMRHMLTRNNLALLTTRRMETQDAFDRIFVSGTISDGHVVSLKEISYLYPLYIYPPVQGLEASGKREPNLSPEFTAGLEQRLGLQFIADSKGALTKTLGPEDVFHYIYAIFHSSTYRERYDQFLRADFPRVPVTDDVNLFRALVALGQQLTDAHLLRSATRLSSPIGFPVSGDNMVEKSHPKYYAPGETPPSESAPIQRGRVYISKSNRRSGKQGQYFDGIAPDVWASRIGGYQPMDKWLKERKERKERALTFDDIEHYKDIAASLEATIRLTTEIDAATTAAGMF